MSGRFLVQVGIVATVQAILEYGGGDNTYKIRPTPTTAA